jgi:hypothetical protein
LKNSSLEMIPAKNTTRIRTGYRVRRHCRNDIGWLPIVQSL